MPESRAAPGLRALVMVAGVGAAARQGRNGSGGQRWPGRKGEEERFRRLGHPLPDPPPSKGEGTKGPKA